VTTEKMIPETRLRHLTASAAKVDASAKALERAKFNRDRQIRKALHEGLSSREIGRAVGLSHVAVLNIGGGGT
jgi:hypothetical protein